MPHEMGRVLLIGAGPGAADLLTVRASRAIKTAQAVLYDALVCDEVLALAPPACTRIQTGKRAGRASMAQSTINRLMLRLALRGLTVVRLKGGDPSVFGRAGEELAFLQGHGVPVEIVPGITAASAAAAQFGFALTHRGEARSLVLATARTCDDKGGDSPAISAASPTLALYMARDAMAPSLERLIREGRSPATPAAAIENAGRPEARIWSGNLSDLALRVGADAPQGPVVVVVGPVVARAARASSQSANNAEARRARKAAGTD
jgi:uroporphyrin-III C-methyltransferase